jgi:hypothetical protein
MGKNLGDYFNDVKEDIKDIKLPTVKTEVEVKPSTSLITTIFIAIAAILLFKTIK